MTNTSPGLVKGFNHTSYTISDGDFDRVLGFLVDGLGFPLLDKGPRDPANMETVVGVKGAEVIIAYDQAPGHRLEIINYLKPDDRKRTDTLRPCDTGFTHLAFDVTDIDRALHVADTYVSRLSTSRFPSAPGRMSEISASIPVTRTASPSSSSDRASDVSTSIGLIFQREALTPPIPRRQSMPVVRVRWFSGKDAKAKKAVAAEITESIVKNTGTDPNYIYVIFEDVAPSNWAGGGKLFGEEAEGV